MSRKIISDSGLIQRRDPRPLGVVIRNGYANPEWACPKARTLLSLISRYTNFKSKRLSTHTIVFLEKNMGKGTSVKQKLEGN